MGNMDWTTVTAFCIGVLTLASVTLPLLLKVTVGTQQQWVQLHAHGKQLNSGMDARIQVAVKAALEAAQQGKPPVVAATVAAAASHDQYEAEVGPDEVNGEPGAR